MFWLNKRDSAVRRTSVTEDWRARLPGEKNALFDRIVREWEDAYAVFSVPLDEAFSMRDDGKIVRARKCAEIAAGSIDDLTLPLAAACSTLSRTGRYLASPPAVASLNPSFFRCQSARQSAQWNQLMHRVLFGGRARFLHKLRVLEFTVIDLAVDFRRTCEDLCSEPHPESAWLRLDELHYDVNTCLREIVVVLKSFLVALPGSSIALFQGELHAAVLATREAPRPTSAPALLGRRAEDFRRE